MPHPSRFLILAAAALTCPLAFAQSLPTTAPARTITTIRELSNALDSSHILKPDTPDGLDAVIWHIEQLSQSRSGQVQRLANKLTQILRDKKITPSAMFANIKPPNDDAPDLDETLRVARLILSLDQTLSPSPAPPMRLTAQPLSTAPNPRPIPPGLAEAMLTTLATEAPGSLPRNAAAVQLMISFMRNGAHGGDSPDPISADGASRAMDAAIASITSGEKMSLEQLGALVYLTYSFDGYLFVATQGGAMTDADKINAPLKSLESRLVAARAVDPSSEGQRAVAQAAMAIANVRQNLPAALEQFRIGFELQELLRGYIAAVNQNDKTAAAKFLATDSDDRLKLADSLRDFLADDIGVTDIKIRSVTPSLVKTDAGQSAVRAQLEALKVADSRKFEVEIPLKKEGDRWLLASPR